MASTFKAEVQGTNFTVENTTASSRADFDLTETFDNDVVVGKYKSLKIGSVTLETFIAANFNPSSIFEKNLDHDVIKKDLMALRQALSDQVNANALVTPSTTEQFKNLLKIRYSLYRSTILSLLCLTIVKQVKDTYNMTESEAETKLKELLKDTTDILVNIDSVPIIISHPINVNDDNANNSSSATL